MMLRQSAVVSGALAALITLLFAYYGALGLLAGLSRVQRSDPSHSLFRRHGGHGLAWSVQPDFMFLLLLSALWLLGGTDFRARGCCSACLLFSAAACSDGLPPRCDRAGQRRHEGSAARKDASGSNWTS